jgi:hypothetical protein
MSHFLPRRIRHRLCFLVLPAGAAACLHHSEPAAGSTGPAPPSEDVALEIANHNWLDVTIYVLHDGQSTRVGTASASSSASFSLPAHLLGQGREIRLIGHPIGGSGAVITETFVVQPGQYVEWTLESDLNRSAIGVY